MAALKSKIYASVLTLWIVFPCLLASQNSNPCEDAQSKKDWDSANSPVYADAMELARTLADHGVVVNCIRRSKEESMFTGQKGAAWFQTSQGVFEAWFLPKTESFNNLKIIETPQSDRRYTYTFQEAPQIFTKFDSSRQMSFIKHANVMVHVLGNQQLADSLRQALR
jgi:hypothetical protein